MLHGQDFQPSVTPDPGVRPYSDVRETGKPRACRAVRRFLSAYNPYAPIPKYAKAGFWACVNYTAELWQHPSIWYMHMHMDGSRNAKGQLNIAPHPVRRSPEGEAQTERHHRTS
jgi:hypothetical protein|eukprot:1181243-Prymnesium_polylepis.4